MSDIFAYDHGALVEQSLSFESVADAFKVEVHLQGNIRMILDCVTDRLLVEVIVRAQDTHGADPVVDVLEPLDLLLRARVVVKQDNEEQSYTPPLFGRPQEIPSERLRSLCRPLWSKTW